MEPYNEVEMHPLQLFTEQIKQPALKIRSIQNASTIALALGPQHTREALLPFLSALFHQQNQQTQIAILDTLPSLIPHLGHSFYSYLILQIVMDIICLYDQKEIREKAFVSLLNVLSRVDIRKAQSMLYNTLHELNAEKQERIKELVIRMIPPIFIGLQPQFQKKLIQLFKSYSTDQNEQVRAVVASQLKNIIEIMPPAPEAQIKLLIQKFLNDDSQKVKIHLVQCVLLLSQLLEQEVVAPYFKKLSQEGNPKIKCEIYQKIELLSKHFSSSVLKPFYDQIQNFSSFDQTIKNKILNKIPTLFSIYPENLRQTYLKELLLPPSSLQLKTTLADSLCILKDEEHLSLILEQGDNSFKIKLLPKLPVLSKHSQMIRELLKHKSYRTRLTILCYIQTRISDEFQDLNKLTGLVLQMLSDKISAVRSTASRIASKLLNHSKTSVQKVKQKIQPYIGNEVWYIRFAALEIVKNLVHNRSYLKLWEASRALLNDKVVAIKLLLVQIANIISDHGVRSCVQETKKIRCEVEDMF